MNRKHEVAENDGYHGKVVNLNDRHTDEEAACGLDADEDQHRHADKEDLEVRHHDDCNGASPPRNA